MTHVEVVSTTVIQYMVNTIMCQQHIANIRVASEQRCKPDLIDNNYK